MNQKPISDRHNDWVKYLRGSNSENLAFIFDREEVVNRKHNTITIRNIDFPIIDHPADKLPLRGDTVVIGTPEWWRYATIKKISSWAVRNSTRIGLSTTLKYHFQYLNTTWYHFNDTGEPLVFETEEWEESLYVKTKVIVDVNHRVWKYTPWNRLLLKLNYFGRKF